jgi:hypothetical protein
MREDPFGARHLRSTELRKLTNERIHRRRGIMHAKYLIHHGGSSCKY